MVNTHTYKLITNTAFQVLVAIIGGVCVGHFYPSIGIQMEIIGVSFINVIKLFIGPIIFLTIVHFVPSHFHRFIDLY